MKKPRIIAIDLFCGFGGTTTGYKMTDGLVLIAACVNHDPLAIESHDMNHPEARHFMEDITTFYGTCFKGVYMMSPQMVHLRRLIDIYRAFYPEAEVVVWASLECTNFSIAKGGLEKDADSRMLAEHMDFYVDALEPDHLKIENVKEFKTWGPLDEKGHPIKERKGEYFDKWCKRMCANFGFRMDWRLLNSADFGAFTSRLRLFGIFTRNGEDMWPEPTHEKNPVLNNQYAKLRWKGVREKLRLNDRGKSVFGRKKPLAERTLDRLCKGLSDHALNSEEVQFISKYHGNGFNVGLDKPSPTIATKDQIAIVQTFLFNPAWFGKALGVDKPCPTLVASQHKAPIYVIIVEKGDWVMPVYEDDTPAMVRLKELMASLGYCEMTMRMMTVEEMLDVQGFPLTYKMAGTTRHHKKFIGNSVHPYIPKAWAISMVKKMKPHCEILSKQPQHEKFT